MVFEFLCVSLDPILFYKFRSSFKLSLEIGFFSESISAFSFVYFILSNVSPHLSHGLFSECNITLFLFDLNYLGFPLYLSIGLPNDIFNLYPKCFLQIISSSNPK